MVDHSNILSKNFQNLTGIALREKINYLTAKPFPNIVLNNFFNSDFLNIILNEFPNLSKLHKSQSYNAKNEIKLSNKNYDKFPSTIKLFIVFLNSNIFLNFKSLNHCADLRFFFRQILEPNHSPSVSFNKFSL